MSYKLDPLSNLLNVETVQAIDNLDLPIMKKHHVRILAHCLQILKVIAADNSFASCERNPLREWCDNQSKKFDDKKFSDLFYEQLESTKKKLNSFSQRIEKSIEDLDIWSFLLNKVIKHLKLIPKKKYIFVELLTNSGNKI
jgi:hypothetical protein